MGINRRKAEREIAFAVRQASEAIEGLTLGKLCAAGVVSLEVSCYSCQCRGRYRLTRLIDQHGVGKGLPVLKALLSADCPKRSRASFYDPCGVYFPKLPEIG